MAVWAVLLAGLSLIYPAWLSLSVGVPTLWVPLPAALVLPIFLGVPVIVTQFVMPLVFWIWTYQLFSGASEIPLRSTVALALLTLLTPTWFALSWAYGVEYQGPEHTQIMLVYNVLFLSVLWRIWFSLRRKRTFWGSLLFHWVIAFWIVWGAFPYLGELP